MSKAPRAVPSRLRRKRVLKQAKGFRGRRKNNITTANAAVDRSMQHAYVGRKLRKRNFRALWIQRINAAVREHGLTYSRFISGLAARRHRDRPQGSGRSGGPRARGVQGSGSQASAARPESDVPRPLRADRRTGPGTGIAPSAEGFA